MPAITIPGPSLLYVKWSCRRCGHTGGVARTTIPVDASFKGELMQQLMRSAREKVQRVHQRGQGCVASGSDFVFEAYVPDGKTLLDTV